MVGDEEVISKVDFDKYLVENLVPLVISQYPSTTSVQEAATLLKLLRDFIDSVEESKSIEKVTFVFM